MVHMMPDWISSNVESSAEGTLFKSFKAFNARDEIYVLHSLGLSEHITNIFGEIDFVVICSKGVLCVEVKGGVVSRKNGLWTFTNRYGKTNSREKGPFEQVQGNMQTLRKYIDQRFPSGHPLHGVQYANCVLIPDMEFALDGPDITRAILFDKSFRWNLSTMIDVSFNYWQNQMDEKHHYHGKYLTDQGCKDLANALRGDFCLVPSLTERYDQIWDSMNTMTGEQYQVLEDHDENTHLLVRGSAGTGKTLLAVEQCRRDAIAGKSVLYVCYNRNIAHRVREMVREDDHPFDVSTLHALMKDWCGDRETGDHPNEYWDRLIPRFLSVDVKKLYDVVILDEGQDLFKERYMRCIDRVLKGGLENGCWVFFYDRNQNVYGENEEMDVILKKLSGYSDTGKCTLSVNCRNTAQISDTNRALTGLDQAKRLKVEGKDVTMRVFSSREDELYQLIEDLEDLKEQGIENSRIVILSPYWKDDDNSCFSIGKIPARLGEMKLRDPWLPEKKKYRFSMINSFKGLEADVIMLMDIDSYEDEKSRMQNYVAISRAKLDLYIYCASEAESERAMMMLRYMKKNQ